MNKILHIPSGNVVTCSLNELVYLYTLEDVFYAIKKHKDILYILAILHPKPTPIRLISYIDVFEHIRDNTYIEEFEVLDD